MKMLAIDLNRFYSFPEFSRMSHLNTPKPVELEIEILVLIHDRKCFIETV